MSAEASQQEAQSQTLLQANIDEASKFNMVHNLYSLSVGVCGVHSLPHTTIFQFYAAC
jgi:hypothetical protein